jgi:hypothetical protein
MRPNEKPACVTEGTAQKTGWEAVQGTADAGADRAAFVQINTASPVGFEDDGRDPKRSILQRSLAPWPMYEFIMDSYISPGDISPDGLVRLPAVPHERYSVHPDTGFHVEDWIPTHIPDGQKMLFAENKCYPSAGCLMRIHFVPTTFVLHENMTSFDLEVSKGFQVIAESHVGPLPEMEDEIERFREIFDAQPGVYGEWRDIVRDGKTVWAHQGGNEYNHYRSAIGHNIDDHIGFTVYSGYHTLDELLPIFDSIGN